MRSNSKYLYCLIMFDAIMEINSYITACEPAANIDMEPIVNIPGFGSVRGATTISYKRQRTIFQYLGIPYAVPPIGRLRFKPPVTLFSLNQDGIYDANRFKQKCPQLENDEDFDYLEKYYDTAEDCLYLNIFTAESKGEEIKGLLPVLIYIHGGGLYEGSTTEFCPNYLLDQNLILVTIQYRLGPLGFLNLETEDVAGNMGFLDQLEAIEWVSKHIQYFGGDRNRITLAGQSSGASSVSLMLISPLVKPGLFQQVIVQSGSFFGEWAVDRNSKKHGIEFAEWVNCTDTRITDLVECLLAVPVNKLILANWNYMTERISQTEQGVKEIGISHAVIQTHGFKKFLSEDPMESMKKGNFAKVPTLTGVVEDEGSTVISVFINVILRPRFKNVYVNKQSKIHYLKTDLFYDFIKFCGISEEEVHLIELAKETYLPSNYEYSSINDTVPALVDLSGALIFKTAVLRFARMMFLHSPTFLYSFNFKGTNPKRDPYNKYTYFDGVAHADDLIYLFPYKDTPLTANEEKTVERMTELWANFVGNTWKNNFTFNTAQKWPPMHNPVGPYLQISSELEVKANFVQKYASHTVVSSPATRIIISIFVFRCILFVYTAQVFHINSLLFL